MSVNTLAIKAYAAALENQKNFDSKVASSGWAHGDPRSRSSPS